MKVFFIGSPRGDLKVQREIYDFIQELGHKHTSSYVAKVNPERFYKLHKNGKAEHYRNMKQAILEADMCIFETSIHSLAVGQLIQFTIDQGKPIISLYQRDQKPFFLDGAEEVEPKIQVIEYSLENLRQVLREAIEYAQEWLESRFTLILNSQIKGYLDKIAKSGVSRSEYIRDLIIQDMEKRKK